MSPHMNRKEWVLLIVCFVLGVIFLLTIISVLIFVFSGDEEVKDENEIINEEKEEAKENASGL